MPVFNFGPGNHVQNIKYFYWEKYNLKDSQIFWLFHGTEDQYFLNSKILGRHTLRIFLVPITIDGNFITGYDLPWLVLNPFFDYIE